MLEEAVRKEPAVRRCKGKCDWLEGRARSRSGDGARVRAYSGLCNWVCVALRGQQEQAVVGGWPAESVPGLARGGWRDVGLCCCCCCC